MIDRLLGLLLFLPVPLVLWLFTRAPLGVGVSLLAGVAVVLAHRPIARPFALSRASHRCLWCGGAADGHRPLAATDPGGTVIWQACSQGHLERLVRTLGWVSRHRVFVGAGIGGALLTFLPLAWLAGSGSLGSLAYADAVAWFKGLVAITVLPVGWIAPWRPRREDPGTSAPSEGPALRLPFPAHIQALVGTAVVVWLFRLVGLWWLAQALLQIARRVTW